MVWRMSQPTPAFVLMTVLSTVIASYGLLAGSAAVVIGAMLIAPLMGPIVGVALSVAIGDTLVFRRAFAAELLGVGIAIGLSVLIGLVPLQLGYGPEILSRTKPTLYDLIIALAAGVAAAYAVADERVSPALPGVAIATALVPPLAACGLCVAGRHWSWAGGAFLLFVANFLAITTVGAATFLAMGVRRPGDGGAVRTGSHARRLAVHIAALAVVGAYMTQALVGLVRDNRLGDGLRRVLREEAGASLGAQLSEVRHERKAGEIEVIATMLTARPFEADSVARMEQVLRSRVDPAVRLVVRSVVARDSDARGPVFVPDEEQQRLSEEARQAEEMASASAVLTRELASEPGTTLVDLAREPGGTLHVTVRTPAPLGPRLVARAEAALRRALARPVHLVVESLLARTVDAAGYADEGGGEGTRDDRAAGEAGRWALLLQNAARERLDGATVVGLEAGAVADRIAVEAVLRAPVCLAPADVRHIEERLRLWAHPSVDLRVRTIVGAVATAEGYVSEPSDCLDLAMLGVRPVQAPRAGMADDPALALCVAAAEGDLAAVRSLVDSGADPCQAGLLGCTPLHHALRCARPETAAYLLDRGADPAATDDLGATPRDWAAAAGRREALHLLERAAPREAAPPTPTPSSASERTP